MAKRGKPKRATEMQVIGFVLRVRGLDLKIVPNRRNDAPTIIAWRPVGGIWSAAPPPSMCDATMSDIMRTAHVILFNFNLPRPQAKAPS